MQLQVELLPRSPLASRTVPVLARCGDHVIVWGGFDAFETQDLRRDGALLDLATREWTTLPPAPIESRLRCSSWEWSDQLVVWGGGSWEVDDSERLVFRSFADGAVFDPEAGWRVLPEAPAPRAGAVAVTRGQAVQLVGGTADMASSSDEPVVFNRESEEWDVLSPDPIARGPHHTVVDTGSMAIVWGGHLPRGDVSSVLDVSGDWHVGAPAPIATRTEHIAVWIDNRMLVWGGESRRGSSPEGALYDPAHDTWEVVPKAPEGAVSATAGVLDHTLVFFGGNHIRRNYTFGLYDVHEQRWTYLGDEVGFWPGSGAAAIRVGEALLVWTAFHRSASDAALVTLA
jgi:hypothetical protein